MKGTVKFFNARKGWGFIINDETKKEAFVHHSNLEVSGFRTLVKGEKVEYEEKETADGRIQAIKVKKI